MPSWVDFRIEYPMRSESLAVALELHDDPTAREQLYRAIAAAQQTGDTELEGQGHAAIGIYFQHHGLEMEAFQELQIAVALLPEGLDKDAAQGHLHALQLGTSCPCSEEFGDMAQGVRDYVLERLPPDLISHLGVQISASGAVSLDVEVNREPSSAEAQLLDTTIDEALQIYGRTTSAA